MNLFFNTLIKSIIIFLIFPTNTMQKHSTQNIVALHKRQVLLNNRDLSKNKENLKAITIHTKKLTKKQTKKFYNVMRDSFISLIFLTSFIVNSKSYKKNKISFGGFCFVNIVSISLLLTSLLSYYKIHNNLKILNQLGRYLNSPTTKSDDVLR